MRKRVPFPVWLLLAALVVVLDQLTKAWIMALLPLGTSVYVLPVLDLVHVRNTGAAFSLLAGASGWQRELFLAIAVAASIWIVWMLVRAGGTQRLFCTGLSLILGGAIGNAIDRIWLGGVVDFLHFHWGPYYWPAFNVADTAITCGAAIVIVDAFRHGRADTVGASGAR